MNEEQVVGESIQTLWTISFSVLFFGLWMKYDLAIALIACGSALGLLTLAITIAVVVTPSKNDTQRTSTHDEH